MLICPHSVTNMCCKDGPALLFQTLLRTTVDFTDSHLSTRLLAYEYATLLGRLHVQQYVGMTINGAQHRLQRTTVEKY